MRFLSSVISYKGFRDQFRDNVKLKETGASFGTPARQLFVVGW